MNIQEELNKLGYVAYRHPTKNTSIIICRNTIPYKDRFSNIFTEIDEKDLGTNKNSIKSTLELIKNKICLKKINVEVAENTNSL